MEWLPAAVLGIIWAAFLVPWPSRRRVVARGTFPELKSDMELRKDATQMPGRWVLAPRKGTRFVGPRERARIRARERRRRIVVVLLEAIGLTALIGVFPPLRAMLVLSGVLALVLLGYLVMVVVLVSRDRMGAEAAGMPIGDADRGTVLPGAASNPSLEADQERLARVVST